MSKASNALVELADEVLDDMPNATKYEWGQELSKRARSENLYAEINDRLNTSMGALVTSRKSTRESAAMDARAPKVGYDGSLLSPVISVANPDGGRQLTLWVNATPDQYVNAVTREQNVVDGRNRSNKVRLQLVERMIADPTLMELPHLKDVCVALRIDPDTLGLAELTA